MNRFSATLLFSLLSILMVTAGSTSGDGHAGTLTFIMTLGVLFLSHWFSDRFVPKLAGAKRSRGKWSA